MPTIINIPVSLNRNKLNFAGRVLLSLVAFISAGLIYSRASSTVLQAAPSESLPALAFPPSSSYLPNPGIGWQESGTVNNPILPETTMYRRPDYSWQDQNPAENVFDWSRVDSDLQTAIQSGKQLAFRIYTMRDVTLGGHKVPAWVLSKGAVILPDGQPDYSNCFYQSEWAKFVEAMRQKYDGNPDIAFIDISGYGNFNEWSWQDGQTDIGEGSLDAQARQRLADMFIGGSGTVQCRTADGQLQAASYSYTGFQDTQLLMPYAGIPQSSRYVASRRADVGFRHDCLGYTSTTDSMMAKVGDVINQVWQKAPVVFEFCPGSTSNQVFINNAAKILRLTHATLVHDNLTGPRSATVLAALLNPLGYRFNLQQFNHPFYIASNQEFTLSMTWANVGYAPTYPKMGQDFELHFYLMEADRVVKDWTINTDISQWMPANSLPGSPPPQVINETFRFPSSSHSKIYSTRVAIIDKRTGKAINLAFGSPDAQGRYPIGGMIVPGPNIKTIFLPLIWQK